MSYTMKSIPANKANYGSKRSLNNIKYIVIHYTGNDGDSAVANGNYFRNNIVKASAHYFVDSNTIVQSVPDDYVAYSVGGEKYSDCSKTGGGKFYGQCLNANSLNIELCDDSKDKKVYPSAETIANAIKLTKLKMKEYGVSKEHVIRHFDTTGKICPDYFAGTPSKNALWKSEFWNKLDTSSSTSSTSSTSSNPSSSTSSSLLKFMKVNTSGSNLNCRENADSNSEVIGKFKKDQEVQYISKKSDWIKVKGKSISDKVITGYCSAKYLKATSSSTKTVTINTSDSRLNCRKSANTSSTIIGKFQKGQKVILLEKTSSAWCKVKGLDIEGNVIIGYCSTKYLK